MTRCPSCGVTFSDSSPRKKPAFEKFLSWFTASDEAAQDYEHLAAAGDALHLHHLCCRPANLTPKSREERASHLREYLEMSRKVQAKRKQEQKEQERLERTRRTQELKRKEQNEQWLGDIIPAWDKKRHSPNVQFLWRQGLPPRVRGLVWPLAIGNAMNVTRELFHIFGQQARTARIAALKSPDAESRAQEALAQMDEQSSRSLPRFKLEGKEATMRFIEMDLGRTFPTLAMFHETGSFYDQLRSVLEAYCFFRPDIGYVQGMSYLAAMLLLYMDPVTAFICLANLLNSSYFHTFFSVNLTQLKKHFKVYEVLFAEHMPSLYNRFQELQISPDMYLMEWFLTLYSKCLPISIASRVWDCFLLDGEVFMFRTALGIIKLYQAQFQKASFEEITVLLSHLPEDIDEALLFEAIQQISVPTYVHHLLDRLN